METMWNDIGVFFAGTGSKILFVLCVLILGGLAIHYIIKGIKILLYRTSLDDSVVSFIASLLKILLWVVLIFVSAGILNLSTSSLVVCLSSVALAVGLALKDSFANLTNGLFIIYNKPFKRGDLIKIGDVTGVVQNIKLLSTELVSLDNCKLIIPNSMINNQSVINYYAMPTRRVDKMFSVAYGTDANLVLAVIREVLDKNVYVIKYPESRIFMISHNSSSIDFEIWAWVGTEDYWNFWTGIQQEIYEAFYKYGISIPFPQVDVHFDKENPEKIVFPVPEGYDALIEQIKEKELKIKEQKENEKLAFDNMQQEIAERIKSHKSLLPHRKPKIAKQPKPPKVEKKVLNIFNDEKGVKSKDILSELKEKSIKAFDNNNEQTQPQTDFSEDKKQLQNITNAEDNSKKTGAQILKELKAREKGVKNEDENK